MQLLADQRCFNHAQREAVGRCQGCRKFFCRECVTEHHERLLCAGCLAALARVPLSRRAAVPIGLLQCVLGLLLAWFCFYLIGERLLSLPASFHESVLWRAGWLDQE
jgi:hypothetical protein